MWKYWKKTRKNKFCPQNDAPVYPIKLDSLDVWTTENMKERYKYSINWVKKEKSKRNALPSCKEHGISLSTVNCSRR